MPRDVPTPHPGEILREEFLRPIDLSVYALAKAIAVPRTRLNDIVRGNRSITPETALRLGRYFGTSAQMWLNMQALYDLEIASDALADQLDATAPRQRAA